MLNRPVIQRLLQISLIPLALLALFSLARIVSRAQDAPGGVDFHSYWFFGHFVRQGENPYTAFARGAEPELPITYLDGATTVTSPVARPGLARTPANTAPLLLFLSLFSWFSWPVAQWMWLAVNVGLMAWTPWLALRLLPALPPRWLCWWLALAFYGFTGVRVAVWSGQTTLLVFVLMLLAHRSVERRPWLAGLALGLALSKYSLALPLALLWLYHRRWRPAAAAGALLAALLTQVAGLLIVSSLDNGGVMETLRLYWQLFLRHTSQPGIHLGGLWPASAAWQVTAAAVICLTVLAALWRWRRQPPTPYSDLLLLALFTLAAVLVAYHRLYDVVPVILFLAAAAYALAQPPSWFTTGQQAGMALATVVVVGLLCLPGEVVGRILPASLAALYLTAANALITAALLLALIGTTWLLNQVSTASHDGDSRLAPLR